MGIVQSVSSYANSLSGSGYSGGGSYTVPAKNPATVAAFMKNNSGGGYGGYSNNNPITPSTASSTGTYKGTVTGTSLEAAQQSILTSQYNPPATFGSTVFIPPSMGGYNKAIDGSGAYSNNNVPNTLNPLSGSLNAPIQIDTNQQSNLGTAGVVPNSTIPVPSTSDGSIGSKIVGFFSSIGTALAAAPSAIYNDTIGPTTVLGNLGAGVGQTVQGDANLLTGSHNQSTFGSGSYVSNTAVANSGGIAGTVQSAVNNTLPTVGADLSFLNSTGKLLLIVAVGAIGYLIASGNIKKVLV